MTKSLDPLSRRVFLRGLGAAAIGAAIGACRPERVSKEATVETPRPVVRTSVPETAWVSCQFRWARYGAATSWSFAAATLGTARRRLCIAWWPFGPKA